MDCILVPRNVYCLDVRRMARAYIAAKIHVRALAEKLQLLIFKANILFFKQQKTRFLVPSAEICLLEASFLHDEVWKLR